MEVVPAIDPEVLAAIRAAGMPVPPRITPSMIPSIRESYSMTAVQAVGGRSIDHRDVAVPVDGAEIALTVFRRRGSSATGAPAVFFVHGGGMFSGDRFLGAEEYLDWVDQLDVVVVSVEYRLAPEHPDPVPVSDCYAGLLWVWSHAEELGIDRDRLVAAGSSAGAGLAAGISLMARDRGEVHLAGSLLASPMLDDRSSTSSRTLADSTTGTWDRVSNDTAWGALLGDRRGGELVTSYAAPARAAQLSGLPPTYVDCATAELFRDEGIEYARRIWSAGGSAELHVWPGGVHGFERIAPEAAIAVAARAAHVAWLARVLAVE
ncbi:alpha/beta hydrolase [soil metagenome]